MKYTSSFLLLILFSWHTLFSCTENESVNIDIQVYDLKVEGLTNPLGLPVDHPRLSWKLSGDENDIRQVSYRILVASTEENLKAEIADLWDSNDVLSDRSIGVSYGGNTLSNNQKAYWKVKVTTNKGDSEWVQGGFWTKGITNYNDWKSTRWIGMDKASEWDDISTFSKLSARYFRKEFEAKKQIKSANLHIIGLGLYELHVNGEKVGDQVLAPVPTDYHQNVKINVFDITSQLAQGKNALGVILGNGRFFTMRQNYKPYKIKNFGFPKMALQLHIEYVDGSKEVIKTDESWKMTADGPIRSNNEYDGEDYDARKEMLGWSAIGFDESSWFNAEYVQEPEGDFQAQTNENMKVMMELKPIKIYPQENGDIILDMGQNMTGWLQIKVQGNKGQEVKLKFAESLNENGTLFLTNLRDAKAQDTYILNGEGLEIWEPRFTYHGFRYVEIKGFPNEPTLDDFVGKMIYDDIQTVGHFETSDPTINAVYNNAWWSIAGNYKGMPVDCPQRNERQPWLGDRPTSSYGESFMFDNSRIYVKWLEDIRLSQKSDGSIPDVAPAFWRYYSDNMSWAGTIVNVTDMLFRQTGDQKVIEENYEAIKLWLEYMKSNYMDDAYILTKDSYGDWCVPPPSIEEAVGQNADVKRPSKLISTAYHYYYLQIMSAFAKIIGREDDIANFQELAGQVKNAFQHSFYNEAGYFGENKMTDNLLALHFGLVNDEHRDKVFDNLVNSIEVTHKGHLSTGVVGVQWLMRTLTDRGRVDLAMKLATNRTYPSWGYMVEHGATTIWELWHGNVANPSMNSQNHVMLLGDLIVWYYENLAGIKSDPENPGFKHVIMKPSFVKELDYVKASHDGPFGQIASHWKREGVKIVWDIKIPANSSATITLPKSISNLQLLGMKGDMVVEELKPSKNANGVFDLRSGSYKISFQDLD
ncbi:glycoside hydrolase family 78 protein [Belliella sp. DSM 111904]|uniref:alpha-L-rhamnosidase n=1 Tax=Belliella filtrata TaxID=2923435 RepID=A0ABS9UW77_9BACT|nr:alpha-L-rhamnosidase [Belliella filtrata]MCH7408068.1 glycoside hydrolase family 78 protein [Belliella filtrata]